MSSSSATDPCPGRDDLVAFSVGRLSTEAFETVALHLKSCRRCEEILDALDNDTTLFGLRDSAHVPFVDEPEYFEMKSTARAIARLSAEARLAVPREPPLPRKFGPYELLDKLGQGSLGAVYMAHDAGHRVVAVKVLRVPPACDLDSLKQLRHPHLVSIHEAGIIDGQHFLATEYLDGGTLSRYLGRRPLPPRQAVEWLLSLTEALRAAHEVDIFHQNLTTSNVLLAVQHGAHTIPKISDLGLATCVGDPGMRDLNCLGVVLYEMLTGRAPAGRGPTEILIPPRLLEPGLPRALEAICLKSLVRDHRAGYLDITAFADDLGRWLRGEPTQARPASWWSRLWFVKGR